MGRRRPHPSNCNRKPAPVASQRRGIGTVGPRRRRAPEERHVDRRRNPQDRVEPRRGDTQALRTLRIAPAGLVGRSRRTGCYKHVAPLELTPVSVHRAGRRMWSAQQGHCGERRGPPRFPTPVCHLPRALLPPSHLAISAAHLRKRPLAIANPRTYTLPNRIDAMNSDPETTTRPDHHARPSGSPEAYLGRQFFVGWGLSANQCSSAHISSDEC